MSQYGTDFSEYNSDEAPPDWTPFGNPSAIIVRDEVGAMGGKFLNYTTNSNNSTLHGQIWDAISGDANNDNIEILVKWRYNNTNSSLILGARVQGAFGSHDAYWHGNYIRGADHAELARHVNGSYSYFELEYGGIDFATDTWYWTRIRINGSDHFYREWADGDPEPATWLISATNSEVTGTGDFLINGWGSGEDMDIDFIGVGTNGDLAPSEVPAGGGATYNESMSLGLSAGYLAANNITADAAMDVGLSAGMLEGAEATVNAQATFASLQGLTLISELEEGPIEASLGFAISKGMNMDVSATANAQVIILVDNGLVAQGTATAEATAIYNAIAGYIAGYSNDVEAQMTLPMQATITLDNDIEANSNISVGITPAVALTNNINVTATMNIGLQTALQLVGQAVVEAGLTMSHISSFSFDGQTVTSTVTYPDGRTLEISLDLRTFVIDKNDRIYKVPPEPRTDTP